MEIMDDTPEINRLADLIVDYAEGCVKQSLAIGADAVVGAGSVVTRDLPPGVLAVGNPARVIRQLT